MSPKPTKPPSSLRRGPWSVILGLLLACGPPVAYAENFQTQGQNTYCVTCSVGIGTSSPVSKLHVFTTNQAQATIESSSGTATDTALDLRANSRRWVLGINVGGLGSGKLFMYDVTASASRLMIDTTGNVGIGTTNPLARLHVWDGNALGSAINNNRLLERISGTTGNAMMRNLWVVRTAVGSDWVTAKLHDAVGVDASFLTPGTDTRTWWERNPAADTQSWGSNATTYMTLTASGLTVSGNLAAKYQDIAEWVPSTRRLLPGTVVVLDDSRVNTVTASQSSYDTKVAGVVSARPGLALGERGEGKILVATTGRVKIKADARLGPIRIGDLLVTSDHEGVAMRSEPVTISGIALHRPGTLIGKALENLEEGEGEILVLLSLQ